MSENSGFIVRTKAFRNCNTVTSFSQCFSDFHTSYESVTDHSILISNITSNHCGIIKLR